MVNASNIIIYCGISSLSNALFTDATSNFARWLVFIFQFMLFKESQFPTSTCDGLKASWLVFEIPGTPLIMHLHLSLSHTVSLRNFSCLGPFSFYLIFIFVILFSVFTSLFLLSLSGFFLITSNLIFYPLYEFFCLFFLLFVLLPELWLSLCPFDLRKDN